MLSGVQKRVSTGRREKGNPKVRAASSVQGASKSDRGARPGGLHRSSPGGGRRKVIVLRGAVGVHRVAQGRGPSRGDGRERSSGHPSTRVCVPGAGQGLVHGASALRELAEVLGRHTFSTQMNVNVSTKALL